ncbi:Hydantoinase B/oxoprolinase-domain-containing protein [Dactylonectria estremocensis]|uniref:Hydantoinase B/oxoprolinase-domain-containing protein n=1 Tax=Dactylonectria estremocensis TaxID=1079267 RepID=A0A9P9IC19_9HYPO|nr:Hydantoinase B/oxoprolinase-domain-containing protein [Dactylonectria estremocensis]
MNAINISIDRGGTFCDVIAHVQGRSPIIIKLLSEDPSKYQDAPTEAIRRVLEIVEGTSIPIGAKLDGSSITSCRVGTTVATNALLTGSGEKFALVTTSGFRDICVIGDQSRPKLFDLNIRKAKALHSAVVEVEERITIEDYELNPFPIDKDTALQDPNLVQTNSGEIIRLLKRPDIAKVREQLRQIYGEGYTSLAISFMHAYLYPDHENLVAELAREVGFKHVTTSSATSPSIKYVTRSNSTCSEAYLYPVIKRYISSFEDGFKILPRRVEFMCSDGGLKESAKFRGNEALLSGPAGGIVGTARSCFDRDDNTPVIGFDMGGTSTDVSRFDGKYDYLSQTSIAGRTITVPMLNIATVAAGGGSILFARNGLLVVGPESAGAYPGPACYRQGGPLTVTDANLFLGRLVLSSFPAIFGEDSSQPLDAEVIALKFHEITAEFNAQTSQSLTAEEIAYGFLDIANETMSRPIRNMTEARGYAPENHNLVSFGGAGGQHACSIADKLGITRILIHKWSSLLSAYGISQADLQYETFVPFAAKLTDNVLVEVETRLATLKSTVTAELTTQGADLSSIQLDESLVLKYSGTDTNLTISKPKDGDYGAAFKAEHVREFAFSMDRAIFIESIKVRGTGGTGERVEETSVLKEKAATTDFTPVYAQVTQKVYLDGSWQDAGVYRLEDLRPATVVDGPALVIDDTQTVLVEPSYRAYILSSHVLLKKEAKEKLPTDLILKKPVSVSPTSLDPIRLSVFAHRFMAIAEQMGNTLQRTSISTSIKERLDFSCAIFSPEGKLVANAPHIPIHLGSMQFAIQEQHRHWLGKLQDGDVLLTNHPQWGGTHLPGLTVVTPVFINAEIAFYVASRGHHTDIGGKGITSMMPESRFLWEEGLNVKSMKIVSGGKFLEDEVRGAFEKAGSYPGCSTTRRLADNISDLKAQTSANQRGITLLRKLCEEYSIPEVHRYMKGIQDNAEYAVREFFKRIAKEHPESLTSTDYLDDGTAMALTIKINPETGSALYDFSGSGPQMYANYNCPISICHSAIIYSIRCLLGTDVPLNEGCLAPVEIHVPPGSVLNPTPTVAICGSTLASQRVIDTILRAFGRYGASQGCANSFGWGMGGKDAETGKITPGWNYGESIGGGVGAGHGYHAEDAVHVHSTNTRGTDPEVVEKRTAVVVRRNEIRQGSGGKGRWDGGNGIRREIEARVPLKFSILSDRRVYRPYGMRGGGPGEKGLNLAYMFNEEGRLEEVNLGGKAVIHLQPGEYIQINTPGGGAYGVAEGETGVNGGFEDFHQAYV